MVNKTHTVDYRVYYEDTDALGIMYHSNYINFCERGRTEMLRELDLPASETHKKLGIGFVIRHIDCNYLKMVKLDDLLTVQTNVLTMKKTSFTMRQTIFCQNLPVFTMDVTIVCINEAGKPTKAPEGLREKFDNYMMESKD